MSPSSDGSIATLPSFGKHRVARAGQVLRWAHWFRSYVAPGRAHEATEVAPQVVDALHDADNLHHRGLVSRAMAEVAADRFFDVAAPPDQRRLELVQIAAPRREGGRSTVSSSERDFVDLRGCELALGRQGQVVVTSTDAGPTISYVNDEGSEGPDARVLGSMAYREVTMLKSRK